MNQDCSQKQQIVTVLGMHRSGTSLVSRILNLMGVYLGEQDDLLQADKFNERGYWENINIVAINDEILKQLGGDWHSPPDFYDGWPWQSELSHLRARAREIVAEHFYHKPVWGWKDPRTCLTLPFWLTVVEPTHFVVCVRNPLDVARSLCASHGSLSFDLAIELWMTYTSLALRHTSGKNRLVLFYDDILQQPRQHIIRLAQFVQCSDLDHDFLEQSVHEIAIELRHHNASAVDVVDHPELPFAVQALYAVLRSAVQSKPESDYPDSTGCSISRLIDIFGVHSNRFFGMYRAAQAETEALRGRLNIVEAQLQATTAQYEAQLQATTAQYEAQLLEYESKRKELEKKLQATTAQYEAQLQATTAQYEAQLQALAQQLSHVEETRQKAQKQVQALQSELRNERRGIGYKMLRRGRTLFTRVFPYNSLQRSMYVAVRKTIARKNAEKQRYAYGVRLPDTLTMRSGDPAYDQWLLANVPSKQELCEQRAASKHLRWQPLISVIMPVYNAPADLLIRAVESVLAQSYPKWELCIVDDGSSEAHVRPVLQRLARRDRRIRVQFVDQNGGIAFASNRCLAMARGDFVVFLDNDDELAPHALFMVAELLSHHPDADLVYSDEDKIGPDNRREQPFFKPDFSYDLLLSYNYICHLLALRRSLVTEIGGFRAGYDGAQDYDLVLRVVERTRRSRIHHIPDVLYHWRIIEGSTSANYWNKPKAMEASLRLLDEHLTRMLGEGYGALEVFRLSDTAPPVYRPRYALVDQPLVSVVIGTRDQLNMLKPCVDSLAATTYSHYEIIIVNNNSSEAATLTYLESLPRTNPYVRVIDYPYPFNYSALNNYGIRQARGDVIVLLNNDVELFTPDWLEIMLGYAQQRRIGAVGVKLLYPDKTIQHAGVIVGVGGVAGHAQKRLSATLPGYAHFPNTVRNYSAVTAACMMFRRAVWEEVGGLDERLAVAFNDVDFCLRLGAAGYDIVYTPQVQLLHHESVSVGRVHLNERRMDPSEVEFMRQRWQAIIEDDPFYNPNLSLDSEDYALHPRRWREMRERRRGRRVA
ncbi:glycosyltransferase [Roseiflexus sp.]|uniref:glycosyltransferase n=1 Tax=Roseiflexus sp. TaxID=2562120 RepID=UPI00398A9F49